MRISKSVLALIIISVVIFSCRYGPEGKDHKQMFSDPTAKKYPVTELTIEQESAFDVLTELQVNSDEQSRLYSTFANIVQPCYPPDTSFVISQSELLIAMKQFVKENYTRLNIEERSRLIHTAVKAQTEYTVLHCNNQSNANYESGLPLSGIWVLPSVLGRRDVILQW